MTTHVCDWPRNTVRHSYVTTTTNVIIVVIITVVMTSQQTVADHTNSTAGVSGKMSAAWHSCTLNVIFRKTEERSEAVIWPAVYPRIEED